MNLNLKLQIESLIKIKITITVFVFLIHVVSYAQDRLNIAIASSLLLPLQEIKEDFENTNNCNIEFISAATGSLTSQILNGAPYDLFIAADLDYPNRLVEAGLTVDVPAVALNGTVYFWSSSRVEKDELLFKLTKGTFERIAISNPELAPFGRTAMDWLIRKEAWEAVQSSLVFGNSVGQVNHYIKINTVNAAFSSNSAAFSQALQSEGFWIPIEGPDISYVPYFYVILRKSKSKSTAQGFINFLSSESSIALLRKYGFVIDE